MYRGGLKLPSCEEMVFAWDHWEICQQAGGDKELTVQRPLVLLPIEKDV